MDSSEELKSNEELLTKVSENEIVGDKNATDKRAVLRTLSLTCQKWLRIAMIRV